ncbi:hypothetical protein M3N64_11785 [Sporolactobacillus sp. CPB3-1]|uniref:Uncharacterized protein n=1 Tax=Sporolactobacillus mangiferae TaxID=2940498 RepID=A0ABT0MCL1_9BACL|nr:hypothetical protein [Sporolactobacillus mangiferae]MCL1632598.1 hypothetical protein [Sporolactobacillus mangiferae]
MSTLLFFILLLTDTSVSKAAVDQLIKSEPAESGTAIIQKADLIVHARLDEHINRWDTGQRLPSGAHFVNAEQEIHVQQILKGHTAIPMNLLTTGIEPLPAPSDSLNKQYTGPLADGEYVLFLTRYSSSGLFILSNGFSSVYPLYLGKTIALEDGFHEFSGKTIPELKRMLHTFQ